MKRLNDTEYRPRGPAGNYQKVQRKKGEGMAKSSRHTNHHKTPRTDGHRSHQVQEVQSGIR